ncbi:MAG: hypothetical protein KJ607_00810 [Bacteroidetes bacterium]|nr:hypothetical protein [Bacteroidota bacterium]
MYLENEIQSIKQELSRISGLLNGNAQFPQWILDLPLTVDQVAAVLDVGAQEARRKMQLYMPGAFMIGDGSKKYWRIMCRDFLEYLEKPNRKNDV